MTEHRRQRGRTAATRGLMAEEGVARHYRAQGAQPLASRWRGVCGEIDLIVQDGPELVFVEVKAARSHPEAALQLQDRQQRRILAAACEYCAERGLGEVAMRFDAALVDASGRIEVIRAAFGQD